MNTVYRKPEIVMNNTATEKEILLRMHILFITTKNIKS